MGCATSVDEITGFQFVPLREGQQYRCGLSATPSEFQFVPLREGQRQIL